MTLPFQEEGKESLMLHLW